MLKPKFRPGCRWQPESSRVLVPEGMVKVAGSGLAILSFCDGQRTVSEILSELTTRFPNVAPEQISRETEEFLQGLRDRGVLELLP
ncbi:MAG: pyrroloquinoline quinone biosynthesis peptide chaperone PqqD [Bdellovibrionales bacterium]|nr:pyrroloquinoline quinone biosynthesis peptide chaperone PqqD [Bdellovibrionales bacterium]